MAFNVLTDRFTSTVPTRLRLAEACSRCNTLLITNHCSIHLVVLNICSAFCPQILWCSSASEPPELRTDLVYKSECDTMMQRNGLLTALRYDSEVVLAEPHPGRI